MLEDEEMHMIDYIIGNTDKKKVNSSQERAKKSAAYKNRKIKIDDTIFYCESCHQTWSYTPKSIDFCKWRKYPLNHIPTIGKKRNKCPLCRSRNGNS